jgi:hypothetical protein
VLTETELNGLADYVLAKNRLHNLHHHGWGVVCGLEVVCHECDGWVTVKPGYAIDPCGNDVIVCQQEDLNLLDLIRQCKEARRKAAKAHCERPPGPRDPKREVEHWCLSLSYLEKEARPTTALVRATSESCHGHGGDCGCGDKGGCGCGGKGSQGGKGGGAHGAKGGCGCGGAGGCTCNETSRPLPSCEPTRILESYRFELCEADSALCGCNLSQGERAYLDRFRECFTAIGKIVRRMPRQATATVVDLGAREGGFDTDLTGNFTQLPVNSLSQRYTSLYDWLAGELRRAPGNLHCALLARLDDIPPPQFDPNDNFDSAVGKLQGPSTSLLAILLQYLLDCLCVATLPSCAPCCSEDDELILACVTVEKGQITHICNHSCRRYAGVFPPSLCGIYLGPMMPLLIKLLSVFCCLDWLPQLFRNTRRVLGDSQRANLYARAATGQRFARLRFLGRQAVNLVRGRFGTPPAEESLNLSSLVGLDPEQVAAAAGERGVAVEFAPVEALPAAAVFASLAGARQGEAYTAYVVDRRVAGFRRLDPGRLAAPQAEIAELRSELAYLKTEVAKLQAGGTAGGGKR